MSEKQVKDAISYYKGENEITLRNRALLEILYSSGLRVSEAVSALIKDIYISEGYIRIKGKRGKFRQVPIGKEALLWIQKYSVNSDGKYLFPSKKIKNSH